MSYVAEEIQVNGNKVAIIADDCAESPNDSMDTLGTILYKKDSRYVLGYKGVESEEMQEISRRKDVICLPVYAYIHSGVVLNTTGFSCPWDSGQSGIIYVEKERVREEYGKKTISKKLKEKVEGVLRSEVETFSMYLSGDVWGYVITDPDGEELEACWGFYGLDDCKEQALIAAESYQEAIPA